MCSSLGTSNRKLPIFPKLLLTFLVPQVRLERTT
jgi:hypothetical protein